MDLEKELLAVLDNPSEVWSAVMTNLSLDSRTLLLVFTSCGTTSLVHWQEAVARVSVDAAARFEGALRSLDDTFVSITRAAAGNDVARFRNPSMDDFCAEHLNRNVGFATTVASNSPTLIQTRRLFHLATSMSGGRNRYPALYNALVKNPHLLLTRLLELVPEVSHDPSRHIALLATTVGLIGRASTTSSIDLEKARSTIGPFIKSRSFTNEDRTLFTLLDLRANSRGVQRLLGGDFAAFYKQLWSSANDLSHFDTMVNIDEGVGIHGHDAEWRDHFESFNDLWDPEGLDTDSEEDAESMRDYYTKIAEHLDLKQADFSEEWAMHVSMVERRAQERQQLEEDAEDARWLSDSPTRSSMTSRRSPLAEALADKPGDPIDAMFEGLLNSDRSAD